jgi:allantoate deiminase
VAANAAGLTSVSPAARADRVMARCDELARYTEEPGRITRPYGTPALQGARDTIAGWMHEAGMAVWTDAIGNVRGRYKGATNGGASLLLGSHFDSVRDAGRFDGTLGVLVGIAAVERLAAECRRLSFSIDIVAFVDEEGLRFQATYLGSSVLAGAFDRALLELTDADGVTLREAIAAFGGDPEALDAAALAPGDAFGYLEVHIEQGPALESLAVPIGVVTGISGQSRILSRFSGEAGHAGTVPMALRRDPLPAAAQLILEAEAMASDAEGLLATVGKVDVLPGASNVIPGSVEISLDVRHPDDALRLAAVAALERRGREIATSRSLPFDWRVMRDHPATACDAALTEQLIATVSAAGVPPVRLPSGAGHDAVIMAMRVPVAMLFVRCAGGISHSPLESVSAGDVAVAIDVVDRVLDSLATAPR